MATSARPFARTGQRLPIRSLRAPAVDHEANGIKLDACVGEWLGGTGEHFSQAAAKRHTSTPEERKERKLRKKRRREARKNL